MNKIMNHRILKLIKVTNGKWHHNEYGLNSSIEFTVGDFEQLIALIKKEISKDVASEFIDDTAINSEKKAEVRDYLKGCNSGLTDALYKIKIFGEENEY